MFHKGHLECTALMIKILNTIFSLLLRVTRLLTLAVSIQKSQVNYSLEPKNLPNYTNPTKRPSFFVLKYYLKTWSSFKVIFKYKFIKLQNSVLQTFNSTAEQRCLSFLEHYSNLASHSSNTQIESYLGITPEFLSKIRKKLSTKS